MINYLRRTSLLINTYQHERVGGQQDMKREKTESDIIYSSGKGRKGTRAKDQEKRRKKKVNGMKKPEMSNHCTSRILLYFQCCL